MAAENEDGFGYEGYLIYNGIYQVDISDASSAWDNMQKAEEALYEELGEFERAFRSNNEGVEKLDLRNYIRNDESIEDPIESVANDFIAYRFFSEDTVEREGYTENGSELETVEIPVVDDADIYWIYPNHMYFRGSESDVRKAVDFTTGIMRRGGEYDSSNGGQNNPTPNFNGISFNPHFLMWIFHEYYYDRADWPSRDISIDELTDASVSGDDDIWGGDNIVGDTTGLENAPPLLQAILKSKKVNMIEGAFDIKGKSVLAEIQRNKVHVKVAREIDRSNKTKRVALSVRFLDEFVDLYDHWKSLPARDKYPPYQFFKDLHLTSRNNGATLDRISPEVRREYCNLRNENPSDWGL